MSETKLHAKPQKSSMAKRRVQKFCKNKAAVVSIILMFLLIMACIVGPLLSPHDPNAITVLDQYAKPSAEHLLGCDSLGRDLLTRVLYGGRWSLLIGIMTSLCVNILGASLGVISGYFGRKVDSVIVTISEFMQLLPTTLIIIMLSTKMDITIWVLVIMWTITGWSGSMRNTRSRVLSVKQEPFVESCVANGIPKTSIMFHHIIPNANGPLIINTTMNVAGYILSESSLSYLGFGLDSTIPTWGNLLNGARRLDLIIDYPWLWIAPGFCILLVTLCVNFIGDGLRDAMDATTR